MMKRFKGKTAVVTGAGSQIGAAVAIRLANEGANVVLIGNSKDRIEATVSTFPQDHTWIHSDHHLTIAGDITNPEQVAAMMGHVIDRFDSIDVVINTVGFASHQSMIDMPDEQIMQYMQKLQQYAAAFCYAAYPYLTKTQGNIINILTCPNEIKPAIKQLHDAINEQGYTLTRSMAIEFAKKGVRVNSVDSSVIAMNDDDVANKSPLGKVPTAGDIAAGIAFLASDDATMITGITLPIDAGISAVNLAGDDIDL